MEFHELKDKAVCTVSVSGQPVCLGHRAILGVGIAGPLLTLLGPAPQPLSVYTHRGVVSTYVFSLEMRHPRRELAVRSREAGWIDSRQARDSVFPSAPTGARQRVDQAIMAQETGSVLESKMGTHQVTKTVQWGRLGSEVALLSWG